MNKNIIQMLYYAQLFCHFSKLLCSCYGFIW